MSKRLIVIVPGAKLKFSRFDFLNKILARFYGHFGMHIQDGVGWNPQLKKFLMEKEPGAETMIFNWSGGITRRSQREAGEALCFLLRQKEHEEVVLLCESLGGIVGETAAARYSGKLRIIEIATPHELFPPNIPNAEIVNIYSPQDTYLKLANKALHWGFGRSKRRHARNIVLPNIIHGAFDQNKDIEYEGKKMKLYDFYRQVIDGQI